MAPELSVEPDGHGLRVGVVASRYNEFVTTRLLQGAREALEQRGVQDEDVTVAWVPGALELPQAALRMARTGRFDALVALGAVVRGETSHYDLVAAESARGIADVARETGVPIGFGVLTTNTVEQATDRAGGRLGNRGHDAALAALEMAGLFRRIDAGEASAQPAAPAAQRART